MAPRKRSIEEIFWSHVRKTDTCWIWTGDTNQMGHGRMYLGTVERDGAHRISWIIHKGPIPIGKFVLHRCDNPSCVRPSHLFIGTAKDNTLDMLAKGRHCHGTEHPLNKITEAQARAIIRDYGKPGFSGKDRAKELGVSYVLVWKIGTRRVWKHL